MRLVIIAAFLLTATLAVSANAQEARGTLLSVNVEGQSEIRPDMATITFGVTASGQTAQAAARENSQRMTRLLAALRGAGLAERDIQTAYVSVGAQYSDRPGHENNLTGYQASNSVRARVRDLDSLGRVIDSAVAAGGNTVNGVSFSLQEPETQRDIARRDAIARANARATLYANALGMTVRRIVSVSEPGALRVEQLELTGTLTTDQLLNETPNVHSVPIAPGEIETRASISVTVELR